MRKRFLALPFLAVFALTSSSFAATMAWEVTGQNTFGTLDLASGNFHQISDLGFLPAGLGQVGGSLYTALEGGTDLYKLDPTGTVTLVGNSSISYFGFGSTMTGLYMVDTVGTL